MLSPTRMPYHHPNRCPRQLRIGYTRNGIRYTELIHQTRCPVHKLTMAFPKRHQFLWFLVLLLYSTTYNKVLAMHERSTSYCLPFHFSDEVNASVELLQTGLVQFRLNTRGSQSWLQLCQFRLIMSFQTSNAVLWCGSHMLNMTSYIWTTVRVNLADRWYRAFLPSSYVLSEFKEKLTSNFLFILDWSCRNGF